MNRFLSALREYTVNFFRELINLFTPMGIVSKKVMRIYTIMVVATILFLWVFYKVPFIPKLGNVLSYWWILYREQGLIQNLWVSVKLFVEAIAWGGVMSCGLAYLTKVPAFKPGATLLSTFRFLGMTGMVLILTVYVGGGHDLKFSLLSISFGTFMFTSALAIVKSVKQEAYDDAYTLRMSGWKAVYEVVILGTASQMMDSLRQNAAIGFMMLGPVEVLARSEGGIGIMLANQDKHMFLAAIFAIQFTLYLAGLTLDAIVAVIWRFCFPYAVLVRGRN